MLSFAKFDNIVSSKNESGIDIDKAIFHITLQ
jgi:hypothetical protein